MGARSVLFPIAAALILSACAGAAAPTAEPTLVPTPVPAATHTAEPSPAASPMPDPTATPVPSAPRGTLLPRHDIGFGAGRVMGMFSQQYGLQVSPDNRRVIATTTAGIYTFSADDLALQSFIHDPDPFGPEVPYSRRIRISRDASLAAVTGVAWVGDIGLGRVKLWDLASGEPVGEYHMDVRDQFDQLDRVVTVDVSPDNQHLAVVFAGGTVVLITVADGEMTMVDRYVGMTETPILLEFDPTGETVTYVFRDVDAVSLRSYGLDKSSGEQVASAVANSDVASWTLGAAAPVFSDAGRPFGYFTHTGRDVIDSWDYASLQRAFRIDRQDRISALAFSSNGELVAVGGLSPAQLEVWVLNETEAPRSTFPVESPLWAVAAASDGQAFYGITRSGSLHKWQPGQEAPVSSVEGFFPVPAGLAFSPDGQLLRTSVTTSSNPPAADIFEFSVQDGALQRIYPDPTLLDTFGDNVLVSLSVSPDGSRLAAVFFSFDAPAVSVFDAASGALLNQIPFSNMLDEVLFMPDGQSLLVRSRNQPLVVVDAGSGATLAEIPLADELGGGLLEIHLSHDGSTLALMGYSAILVYDAGTLDLIAALDDPAIVENTNTIALSGDGSLIAFRQYDGTIWLWDVTSGSRLPPFQDVVSEFFESVYLAFSPDSRTLAIARWDGTLRLFDVAP